jgi:hypothetical protein
MSKLSKIGAILGLVLFLSSLAFTQGPGTLSGQVIQPAPPTGTGGPAAFATVRVCPNTALGVPCSPTANLFSDQALTQPVPNPFTTDQFGNYSFYLTSGYYIVQIAATPTVTYSYQSVAVSNGTVTSVGLALPASVFAISGSPVVASGTLTGTFINQSANTVFGNCTGGSTVPSFCSITGAMLPPIPTGLVPWATPGTIGSTTPNTGVFTTLNANTSFTTPSATITTAGITTLNASGGGSLAGTFTGSPTLSGNPAFSGTPTSTTQALGDNTTSIATDAFVQANIANVYRVLFKSGVAINHLGDLTEDTIWSVTVPAFSANSQLRIMFEFEQTVQDANTTTYRVKLNGQILLIVVGDANHTNYFVTNHVMVTSLGQTHAQFSTGETFGQNVSTVVFQNSTNVDMSVPQTLVITAQNSTTAGNTQIFTQALVEMLQ